MKFIVYKILEDEPNKGYYWGSYEDPVKLAYACFTLSKQGVHDIEVLAVDKGTHVPQQVEW